MVGKSSHSVRNNDVRSSRIIPCTRSVFMVVRNDNVLLGNVELRMFQKIFAYRLGKIGEHVTRGPKCAGGFGKADCFEYRTQCDCNVFYFTHIFTSLFKCAERDEAKDTSQGKHLDWLNRQSRIRRLCHLFYR